MRRPLRPSRDRRISTPSGLLDPHPKMPDLPLSRAAAEDIAAYVETLRQ
jgi:hypothetical protein